MRRDDVARLRILLLLFPPPRDASRSREPVCRKGCWVPRAWRVFGRPSSAHRSFSGGLSRPGIQLWGTGRSTLGARAAWMPACTCRTSQRPRRRRRSDRDDEQFEPVPDYPRPAVQGPLSFRLNGASTEQGFSPLSSSATGPATQQNQCLHPPAGGT